MKQIAIINSEDNTLTIMEIPKTFDSEQITDFLLKNYKGNLNNSSWGEFDGNIIFKTEKQKIEFIDEIAKTLLQLLSNTGTTFEDQELSLSIIEETLKKTFKQKELISFLEYIQNEIKDMKQFIIDRAYGNGFTGDINELFDVDTNDEIFTIYDTEELENHNFDLGQYIALTNMLRKLKY